MSCYALISRSPVHGLYVSLFVCLVLFYERVINRPRTRDFVYHIDCGLAERESVALSCRTLIFVSRVSLRARLSRPSLTLVLSPIAKFSVCACKCSRPGILLVSVT